MNLPQLRRIRWAVRATLTLGVSASVAANILHAQPNLVSRAISAWSPLALLLTIELISRVPVHRRSLAVARMVATLAIAAIAAWVSYGHMQAVAGRYGETGASPYLLPFSVDGLIVVASVCLVELGGKIRVAMQPVPVPVGVMARSLRSPDPVATNAPQPVTDTPRVVTDAPRAGDATDLADAAKATDPVPEPTPSPEPVRKPTRGTKRQPSAAERIARAHARSPKASDATLAARLELSEATVRRHRRQLVDSVSTAPAAA